jgi:hypothetical protein
MEKLLKETHKLARANHEILKGIRRNQRWSRFFKFFYWGIIIVIILGGYFYILSPLLDRLTNAYNDFNNTVTGIQTTGENISNAGENVQSFFTNIFKKDSE